MRRLFLIDLENVRSPGLKGTDNLCASDKIIVFYSKNVNQLLVMQVEEMLKSKATIEFQEVSVGRPNALDFQLVFQLGLRVGNYRGKELIVYIISHDKGFDCVGEYAKKNFKRKGVWILGSSSTERKHLTNVLSVVFPHGKKKLIVCHIINI